MIDDIEDTDVPKYRKRAKKTTVKKADHEHENSFCVFEYKNSYYTIEHGRVSKLDTSIGEYCPVCGKIRVLYTLDRKYTMKSNTFYSNCAIGLQYNQEAIKELNANTRTLPTFHVDDIWNQKFIDIDNGAHK